MNLNSNIDIFYLKKVSRHSGAIIYYSLEFESRSQMTVKIIKNV